MIGSSVVSACTVGALACLVGAIVSEADGGGALTGILLAVAAVLGAVALCYGGGDRRRPPR